VLPDGPGNNIAGRELCLLITVLIACGMRIVDEPQTLRIEETRKASAC
jgi:hypothetical protein